MKKYYIIGAVVLVAAAVLLFLLWKKDLTGKIMIPFIAHQKPNIDPHLPSSNSLADKLDEVLFDGLFNISANPSGITYEDALGELIAVDDNNIVSVRLKPDKKWHNSYSVLQEDDEINIDEGNAVYFTAQDLRFTLQRIQRLASLSPDFILTSQAFATYEFEGPDAENIIRFKFRGDRIWTESDIKEVLSFKILPYGSDQNTANFSVGSGPYLSTNTKADVSDYYRNPDDETNIPLVGLVPFIDNSTYTTELNNNNFNVLLETPFGSLSPILADQEDFFSKSNISTTFFALLFNTQRLSRDQRKEVRKLIDNRKIINRFYKVGSEQQRHIADYKGNRDNYADYLNFSIFPSSTYYVEEQIIMPQTVASNIDYSILPDTVHIQACLNFGFREEYMDLIEILNDPTVFQGKLKVSAVQNQNIKNGNYDALLLAISGYRSTFLFDLYDIFLREPNLETYKINLQVTETGQGKRTASPSSLQAANNFFKLDAINSAEKSDIQKLLEYIYAFMSTREIGDKQAYAGFIDEIEYEMALGVWLFSLPSLAYFTSQFDNESIDLYGVASQLSTIEKWQEKQED